MGDSILDWVTGPGLQQLLGFSGDMGASPQPPPQQPPPPPPNIMANAPQSFAPNSSFDGGGLPFNQRFSPGPEPSMPPPSFADRAAPAEGAIRNGDFDPQGQNFTPYKPMQFAPDAPAGAGFPQQPPPAAAPAPPPPPPDGAPKPIQYVQSQVAWPGVRGAQAPQSAPIINRTARNAPADGPDMSPAAAMRRRDEGAQSIDEMELDRRGGGPPPTNILPGGLAASLGAAPAQSQGRAISNALMGLGKGLTAVGAQRPGASGAASFAAGAGGALEGSGQHEDKQRDRDTKAEENRAALGLRGATLAENQRYHQDRVDVEREKMTARLNGTGAGQSGSIERLAKEIREEAGKDENGKYKMPLADAVSRARAAPTDRSDELRRERLALDAFKDDKKDNGNPQYTLEQWRKYYGLGKPEPAPPPPLPMGTRRGVDPDRGTAFPAPAAPPPAPTVPPQVPTAPVQAGAPLSRPVVPGTPVPPPPGPAAAPPTPAPTAPPTGAPTSAPKRVAPPLPKGTPPGSGWSDKWQVWRSPDGKFFDKDGKSVPGPSQ